MGLCWKLELEIAHLFLNFAICLVLEFGGKKRKPQLPRVEPRYGPPNIFKNLKKKKLTSIFIKPGPTRAQTAHLLHIS